MNTGQILILVLFGVPYVLLNVGLCFAREKVIAFHVRFAMALGVPEEEARKPRYNWWVHCAAGVMILGLFLLWGWLGSP